MADTRYSREDYVRLARFHEERCRAAGPHQRPECSYCETAAALREAANRAPTHEELVDRELGALVRASFSAGAWRLLARELRERNGDITGPLSERLCRIATLLDTPTPEPAAPQQGHSTWDLPSRARLLHAATTDSREPTTPRDVGVVWYPTLDDIHAAFVAGWAEDGDAVWGGETEDGEEVTFTTDEMLAGIREQGMWGFERGGMIHLWCEPRRVRSHDFLHLVAHEIAHSACGHDGTMEDELEAERYGAVAAQAYLVMGMIAGECDETGYAK